MHNFQGGKKKTQKQKTHHYISNSKNLCSIFNFDK